MYEQPFCKQTTVNMDMTVNLGEALGSLLVPNDLVLLSGDLGAGKTTFTRGIAAGIGLDPNDISSPSFSIVHEYILPSGRGRFVHADLYRLEEIGDIYETGIDDLVNHNNIVVVEWGNVLYDERLDFLDIHILYDSSNIESGRTFLFYGGVRWHNRLRNLTVKDDEHET